MNYGKDKQITIEATIEYDYNCDDVKEIIAKLLELKGQKKLSVDNDN